jgi:hypothetical protein
MLASLAEQVPELSLLFCHAGWYCCLRVPAVMSEPQWVLTLKNQGVCVHPGFFFDFDREAILVVSLLPAPDDFARACAIMGLVFRSILRP